jgi:hypothetical protein
MKLSILLFLLTSLSTFLYGQGCSDAGFCSLGVLKNNTTRSNVKNSVILGANYGAGEQGTSTFNPYIGYNIKGNEHFSYQLKATAAYASGSLGSNFNMGDVFGFVNYTPNPVANRRLSFLGGIKIPLSEANDKNEEGKPLPMAYQSSLGTFDFIGGLNYIINNQWEVNGGLQIPVIQKNKNSFFPDEYSDSTINNFPPTNLFKRKSDVLFRIGYYFHLKESSITIKPNILGIYHLGEDSYQNKVGERENISGSAGLTLNLGLIASKRFKNKDEMEFIVAAPAVVRDVRPDGLTRSLVINVQYSINF